MKTFPFANAAWLSILLVGSLTWAQETRTDSGEIFKQLDRDGNGKLETDEIPGGQRQLLQRLTRFGDRDKDGALDREEFSIVMEYRDLIGGGEQPSGAAPFQPPFDPRRIWEMADRNADGQITVEEAPERIRPLVLGLLRRAGKAPGEALTEDDLRNLPRGGPESLGSPRLMLLRRLDNNRDGKLSKEELAHVVDKFDEFDTNGDGALDLRELIEFPTARPQRRD